MEQSGGTEQIVPTLTAEGTGGTEQAGGTEEQPLSLSPRVLLFWRLGWVIGTAVLLVGAALGVVVSDGHALWMAVAAGVLLVGVFGGTLWPSARYRRWHYWVNEDAIELRHGVIFRAESSIPHFRVQHIDVRQGPLQRAAGIVELVISTASAATDATLPGVDPERAEAIRQAVLARADADDAV